MKDESVIPEGPYCYSFTGKSVTKFLEDWGCEVTFPETKACPYFCRLKDGEAYCDYLEEEGTYMLEDMCKECGINYGDEDD
jgi:hypothetical protein